MFDSVEEFADKLAATGYFIDPVMTQVVFLAAKLQKPLLLEGPAGSGKTQLAVSVAAAAATHIERLQCYRGVTEDKAIGRFDESLQRLYMEFSKGEHENWQTVQANLKGRDFFRPGPLMRALECDKPCVLLIDELDKVDDGFEAQAFKRAASCYGLGRYLYNFREMWVSLDDHKQPIQIPALPKWALPTGKAAGSMRPTTGLKPATVQRGPIDQKMTAKIEGFQGALGAPIYAEILRLIAKVERARDIPNAQLQLQIAHWMERALRGIEKVRALAKQIGETRFNAVLEQLQVNPTAPLPDLETLKLLAAELEQEAAQVAA
jgi:hypothetical protein